MESDLLVLFCIFILGGLYWGNLWVSLWRAWAWRMRTIVGGMASGDVAWLVFLV